MNIYLASKENLNDLIPLFDGYRVFYKQESNFDTVKKFLTDRFEKRDSVIFIATDKSLVPVGFTQLYPSFSSVSMQRTYILNDLFVIQEARGLGYGEAILEKAKEYALEQGSKGLTLETDIDNPAQHLYERLGWKKDLEVFHYTWKAN